LFSQYLQKIQVYHVARLSDLRKYYRFDAKANTIDFNNQSLISVTANTHTHTQRERRIKSIYLINFYIKEA